MFVLITSCTGSCFSIGGLVLCRKWKLHSLEFCFFCAVAQNSIQLLLEALLMRVV